MSNDFISNISHNWLFQDHFSGIELCYCVFNKSAFNNSLFDYYNIELPSYLNEAGNKRKADYLAGRICAKSALEKLDIRGYPLINNDKTPIWPTSSCGSISHSNGLATAAVGLTSHMYGIGIDIEHCLSIERSQRVASNILSTSEQERFKNSELPFEVLVTLIFSAKESLFKTLFPLTKRHFYFMDAELVEYSNHEFKLRLLKNLSNQWRVGNIITGQFCIFNGYVWSVICL